MSLSSKIEELKKRFREALQFIDKKDAVQAAEKLYKVAENAIKILSEIKKLAEYNIAKKEGTWWTKLLDRAARKLRDIYGEEILNAWTTAYRFHQMGFHEEQLTIEEILKDAYKIEDLIKIVESEIRKSLPE
ncbi:MAG: PaREP1 family protein [Candidatus Baldrarchaeia archaeon]